MSRFYASLAALPSMFAMSLLLLAGCARQGEEPAAAAAPAVPAASGSATQASTASAPGNSDAAGTPISAKDNTDGPNALSEAELKKRLPPPKITPVTLHVALSPKAQAELQRTGETILLDVVYGGDPVAAAAKRVNAMGVVELGRVKKEVKPNETITLAEDVINKGMLSQIIGQPQIMINVTSSRKSSRKNILACDFYWETLSVAGKAPLTIPCKLASEQGK